MFWTDEQRKAFELNRASWDERVGAHWTSDMYRRHADALRGGQPCVPEDIVRGMGDVEGKALVHLQCHMGMETLSWSLLGANATGLDFSQPAIEKAELLRDELKLGADFVCANVYDAAEVLGPGGRLYMNEVHPFTEVFDDHPDAPGIAVQYAYMDAGRQAFDCPGTYADPDAQFQHTQTVDYLHTIGSVLNALIRAGLVIDSFDESARCVWPRFKVMEKKGPDDWSLPGPVLDKLPNVYTLLAHKA
jgi:hypothetical protein